MKPPSSDHKLLSQQLIAALEDAQAQAAKPVSTSRAAAGAWQALKFDFPASTAGA